MTEAEYLAALLQMFDRGWAYSDPADPMTKFGMGTAEMCLLSKVPDEKKGAYFKYARERVVLTLGSKRISLHEYLKGW